MIYEHGFPIGKLTSARNITLRFKLRNEKFYSIQTVTLDRVRIKVESVDMYSNNIYIAGFYLFAFYSIAFSVYIY